MSKIIKSFHLHVSRLHRHLRRWTLLLLKSHRSRRLISLTLAILVLLLWSTVHYPPKTAGESPLSPLKWLIIFGMGIIILTSSYSSLLSAAKRALLLYQKKRSERPSQIPYRQLKSLGLLILTPLLTILSLLIIDLIAMALLIPPTRLYSGPYQYLTTLYFGAFAVLGFSVSAYVASVRHRKLKTSERRFEYTQEQDREEAIDKRFLEGIKLLSDNNESVRVGGIYILWEIVKDAIHALPYLDDPRRYGYIYYRKEKHRPIVPYRTDRPERVDEKVQQRLKELYLEHNPANQAEIKAYKKAFSLHEQILNILSGHLRTRTTSEDYLMDYYPSIAKRRFNRSFTERYGETPHLISSRRESPSSEIALLFHLLTRRDDSSSITLVRALNFKLDFSKAILKGVDGDRADLSYANLHRVDFTNALLNYVSFDHADCRHTNFERSTLNISTFLMTDCKDASFINAQLNSTIFKFTNCIGADFTNLLRKVRFYGVTMQNTRFSYSDFMEERITFEGINGLPGVANCTSLEGKAVISLIDDEKSILIHPNKSDELASDPELYAIYQRTLLKEGWRISIHEAYFALLTLRRTGKTLYLGETYRGYRSLELIQTREQLQVFYRKLTDVDYSISKLYSSLTEEEQRQAKAMFTDFDDLRITLTEKEKPE